MTDETSSAALSAYVSLLTRLRAVSAEAMWSDWEETEPVKADVSVVTGS